MSINLGAKCKDGKEMHKGGGARKCMHGYVCQLSLCALNFLRAYRCGFEFQLGSEVSQIKDYDDMILKYKEVDGREIQLYLQSKHIQNCRDKAITVRHLLIGQVENKWKEERFLLSKYYESYLRNEIRSEENVYKNYFIIYTNMDLDIEDLLKEGIDVVLQSSENTSRFFQINDEGETNCYKLSVDENHPLFDKLYTLSDSYKVAQELVERIKDQKALEMKNEVLQKYKHFLVYRVLVRSMDDERKRRFSDDFVLCETLSPKLQIFRNIFKKLYYDALKPNYEFECEDAFQEDLKSKRVVVSRSFLKLDEGNIMEIKEFPDPSKCIKSFFNDFVLAVKQPNVTELEEIIKKEIKEIFCINDIDLIVSVIKANMLDWMKENTGTWLTRDDAESFIQGIKQNQETLMIRGISSDYQNELSGMNCVIKTKELERDNTVQAIRNFLSEDGEIILIRSNQSLLSLLKVHQGIIWMKDSFTCLEKDDDLLFLSFACLSSSENVRNNFNEKNTFNLLVSHIQENILTEIDSPEYLTRLLSSVVSKKRKIILIFQEDVSYLIDSIIKDLNYEERVFKNNEVIVDNSLSFLQLDEKAQNLLLRLEVVEFQGKLTNLLSFAPEIKNVIDAETLQCLVQKRHILVGNFGLEIDPSDSYIPRQLFLYGSSSEASNEAVTCTVISEDELLSNEFGKVLIISGGLSYGKSWLALSLSQKLKMRYPNMWVLKIDLNNYAEIFNKMALHTPLIEQYTYAEDTEKTVEFIIEKILMGPSDVTITTRFEKQVLKLGFRGEMKLALLIDGFSELCKDGSRFVLQLLKGLLKTNLKMLLITTRPENICALECLEGVHFSLDSLASKENLNVVTLKSAIKVSPELEDKYQLLGKKLTTFLSNNSPPNIKLKEIIGKDDEEVWQNIVEKPLAKILNKATDGNYDSASSVSSIIGAFSYMVKKKLDVTTLLE